MCCCVPVTFPRISHSESSMNPREYEIMADLEEGHWWYRSLRDLVGLSIMRHRARLPANPAVFDVGCGTGENLKFVRSLVEPSYIGGFDASDAAVERARIKAPECDVYLSNLCVPEFHHERFDIVISCDLINIPGTKRCMAGLLQIVERVNSNGLFVLNVPAFDWLMSDHDIAVHTSHRYIASEIRDLLHALDLKPALLTYRLCPLLPLFIASRLPSILRKCPRSDEARSSLNAPPIWLNRSLESIAKLENRAICRGIRFPFGSSIFAVGVKS